MLRPNDRTVTASHTALVMAMEPAVVPATLAPHREVPGAFLGHDARSATSKARACRKLLGALFRHRARYITRSLGALGGRSLEPVHLLAPRLAPELDGRAHIFVPLETLGFLPPAEHREFPLSPRSLLC